MTIEKLPSGSYRVRQMENGRMYSVTVPFKPSTRQAYQLIQDKKNHVYDDITFSEAAQKYIDVKKNILSPSTIRAYTSLLNNLPDKFLNADLSQLDEYTIQKLINDYAVDHSPKTVRNLNGFIMSVIRLFYPKTDISITLPQKVRTEHYTPTQEDVKRIMEESKGTKYYIPLFLACLGLRNSEICALTIFDLNGTELMVNKACVRSLDGYVIKNVPKTDASYRTITISQEIADAIREQGYIYNGYPQQIDKHLRRTQKKLNIPPFGIHRMRHFFASYMHDLGYSDAIIQALGGWSTDSVMRTVYRHAMNEDEVKKAVVNDFSFL